MPEMNTPEHPISSSIVIELSDVKNSKGHVLVSLFNASKGWPDEPDFTFKKLRIPAKQGIMQLRFEGVPQGTYALAVIHDENDNLKLDTGMFGIPKEGFCFSNNAMGTFGPPSFESASFKSPVNTSLKLKISYW